MLTRNGKIGYALITLICPILGIILWSDVYEREHRINCINSMELSKYKKNSIDERFEKIEKDVSNLQQNKK